MKKLLTFIIALLIVATISPIQANAETVGETINGTLSTSWPNKGSGYADIILTKDGSPIPISDNRISVGHPMGEVNSVSHSYTFTPSQPGTYKVTLKFDLMASANGTEVVLWTSLPTSVSKTHIVTEKQAVITTKDHVTDTKTIKFTTKQIKTDKLFVGQSNTTQKGVDGKVETFVTITYTDDKETGRTEPSERVVQKMVEEIVEIGTKVKEAPKPVVKDPEPQPEKTPVEKVEEPEVDLSKLIKSITISSNGENYKLSPEFNPTTYTYSVKVPNHISKLNISVDHQDLKSKGVQVNYDKEIDLEISDETQIMIIHDGILQPSYSINFVKDSIKEFTTNNGEILYYHVPNNINDDESILTELNLTKNELGFFEIGKLQLGILSTNTNHEEINGNSWWIIENDTALYKTQPIVINGKLYLIPTNDAVKNIIPYRLDEIQDFSALFSRHFVHVDQVLNSPIYGYVKDGKYIIPYYENNEIKFMEVDSNGWQVNLDYIEEVIAVDQVEAAEGTESVDSKVMSSTLNKNLQFLLIPIPIIIILSIVLFVKKRK